jgi:hypothetical protein
MSKIVFHPRYHEKQWFATPPFSMVFFYRKYWSLEVKNVNKSYTFNTVFSYAISLSRYVLKSMVCFVVSMVVKIAAAKYSGSKQLWLPRNLPPIQDGANNRDR